MPKALLVLETRMGGYRLLISLEVSPRSASLSMAVYLNPVRYLKIWLQAIIALWSEMPMDAKAIIRL